jgi:hypothetical protein
MKLSTGLRYNTDEKLVLVRMGDLEKTDSPRQTTVPTPEWTYTVQASAKIIYWTINPNVLGPLPGFIGLLVKFWVVTPRETYGS